MSVSSIRIVFKEVDYVCGHYTVYFIIIHILRCVCLYDVRVAVLCLSGDSGVWGLKKNFALLELLERLQNGASNQSGIAEDVLKEMGEVNSRPLYVVIQQTCNLSHISNL